jgi:protein-disulfide isomerase
MKLSISFIISLLILTSCTVSAPTVNPPVNQTPTENRTVATPTYGSGKTQVEIFADFQCPACIAYNDSVMPIFEEYASQGKIMMTYRQFPLQMHKNAK